MTQGMKPLSVEEFKKRLMQRMEEIAEEHSGQSVFYIGSLPFEATKLYAEQLEGLGPAKICRATVWKDNYPGLCGAWGIYCHKHQQEETIKGPDGKVWTPLALLAGMLEAQQKLTTALEERDKAITDWRNTSDYLRMVEDRHYEEEAKLQAERDSLRGELQTANALKFAAQDALMVFMKASPAQMSWRDGLVTIDAAGTWMLVDEVSRLTQENDLLKQDLAEQLPMRDADAYAMGNLQREVSRLQEQLALAKRLANAVHALRYINVPWRKQAVEDALTAFLKATKEGV